MRSEIRVARRLRREQTDAERVLWFRLRDRRLASWKFRRQVPIGHYVVDFCCPAARLIVELDGGQHSAHQQADERRSDTLVASGYRVLRFWNNDVLGNSDGVVATVLEALTQGTATAPHPDPLPASGEREKKV